MKLRVEFGIPATKIREVGWYDDIDKMPRAIDVDGEVFEWVTYYVCLDGRNEYVVAYIKADPFTYIGIEVPSYEKIFGWQRLQEVRCECGATYNRNFPHVHSYWCPKWEQI